MSSTYLCEQCLLMFTVFGTPRRKKLYCPSCAERTVVEQKSLQHTKEALTNLKTRWKKEELDTLQLCLKGKLEPYQAAIMLGRSRDSVGMKLSRIRAAVESR